MLYPFEWVSDLTTNQKGKKVKTFWIFPIYYQGRLWEKILIFLQNHIGIMIIFLENNQ